MILSSILQAAAARQAPKKMHMCHDHRINVRRLCSRTTVKFLRFQGKQEIEKKVSTKEFCGWCVSGMSSRKSDNKEMQLAYTFNALTTTKNLSHCQLKFVSEIGNLWIFFCNWPFMDQQSVNVLRFWSALARAHSTSKKLTADADQWETFHDSPKLKSLTCAKNIFLRSLCNRSVNVFFALVFTRFGAALET